MRYEWWFFTLLLLLSTFILYTNVDNVENSPGHFVKPSALLWACFLHDITFKDRSSIPKRYFCSVRVYIRLTWYFRTSAHSVYKFNTQLPNVKASFFYNVFFMEHFFRLTILLRTFPYCLSSFSNLFILFFLVFHIFLKECWKLRKYIWITVE